MFKLFSIDLDGTLLDDNYSISNENMNAIKKAKEKGYIICINTGRNYPQAIEYCKLISADYLIYLHGCLIKDLANDKFVGNKLLNFLRYIIFSLFSHRIVSNKSSGLKRLCKNIGIELRRTVSIGDSVTDIDMIINSGLGLCVMNSDWAVKDVADYTVKKDNNNSAVAEAIYYAFKYW